MKFIVRYLKAYTFEVEEPTLARAEIRAQEMARLWPAGEFKILSIMPETDTPDPPVLPPPPKPPTYWWTPRKKGA